MQDVRVLMALVYPIQLAGLALIVILGFVLHRSTNWRRAVPTGLKWGAILTLSLLAALIGYVLINFDAFFPDISPRVFRRRQVYVPLHRYADPPIP